MTIKVPPSTDREIGEFSVSVLLILRFISVTGVVHHLVEDVGQGMQEHANESKLCCFVEHNVDNSHIGFSQWISVCAFYQLFEVSIRQV